jgi:UDP-N-acetylglucosamine 4,6-dehydratase/5-epimerase
MTNFFNGKILLLTGGTGSWGQQLTKKLLKYNVKEIRIFSRNENAQVLMERSFNNSKLKFIIGDIRNYNSLLNATKEVNIVFHCAALKHIPVGEIQSDEFIYTNVNGTINLKNACIENKVNKVILVSTDKACFPINNYGATKLISEKIFIQANQLSPTKFCIIRAGNVLGSAGSIVPYFLDQIKRYNKLSITSFKMTRFFLTLEEAIKLLLVGVENSIGGEIFVMNMPSFYIKDIAKILIKYYGNDKTEMFEIGLRPGEKLHEILINENEYDQSLIYNDNYYVILPQIKITGLLNYYKNNKKIYFENKKFSSDINIEDINSCEKLLKLGGFLL